MEKGYDFKVDSLTHKHSSEKEEEKLKLRKVYSPGDGRMSQLSQVSDSTEKNPKNN